MANSGSSGRAFFLSDVILGVACLNVSVMFGRSVEKCLERDSVPGHVLHSLQSISSWLRRRKFESDEAINNEIDRISID